MEPDAHQVISGSLLSEGMSLRTHYHSRSRGGEKERGNALLFFCLIFFRERGREGEKYQSAASCTRSLLRGGTRHPGMCPDGESNQQPFTSQDDAPPTEPAGQGCTPVFNTSYWHHGASPVSGQPRVGTGQAAPGQFRREV